MVGPRKCEWKLRINPRLTSRLWGLVMSPSAGALLKYYHIRPPLCPSSRRCRRVCARPPTAPPPLVQPSVSGGFVHGRGRRIKLLPGSCSFAGDGAPRWRVGWAGARERRARVSETARRVRPVVVGSVRFGAVAVRVSEGYLWRAASLVRPYSTRSGARVKQSGSGRSGACRTELQFPGESWKTVVASIHVVLPSRIDGTPWMQSAI